MWWPFSPSYPEVSPTEIDSLGYDYVVVGGGTAGCVLASRLSENPEVSVLLLERGPVNDTWLSRIPIFSSNILRSDGGASSWLCEPMKYCNDRRSLFFCGEIMGGGSRINSMVYSRGTAADYNAWAAMGHPEWSYEKVLPYFVKSEKCLDQPKSNYRGTSGPWITKTFTYFMWLFRVYQTFTDIAEAMGFVRVSDTNAPDAPPDALVTFDSTINEKNQRVSTFDAFLPREVTLKRTGNLTICPNTLVSRIVFSRDGDKNPRANQVLFKRSDPIDKRLFSVKVKREVTICSGSIGSPQVLMMSGVGPREHLKKLDISVVHDLPGVGSELTDHISVPVAWEIPLHESLSALAISPIVKGGLEFLKYIFFGTGKLAMPIQTLSLFVRTTSLNEDATSLVAKSHTTTPDSKAYHPQDDIPDIELMPLAVSAMDNLEEHNRLFSKIGVFSLLATLAQPHSRGTVRLQSSDPHVRPKIDFGLLSDPRDVVTSRKAVRFSLEIGRNMKDSGFPILRNLTFDEEKKENDKALDDFIRERVRTTYHYASTCRMAPENDPIPGVVDDELRVHGLSNVRVCDTSVFPQITSSHLQAPAVMVAERCADFIKETL